MKYLLKYFIFGLYMSWASIANSKDLLEIVTGVFEDVEDAVAGTLEDVTEIVDKVIPISPDFSESTESTVTNGLEEKTNVVIDKNNTQKDKSGCYPNRNKIRLVQQHLADLGLYKSTIDGIVGPGTRSAIIAAKKRIGTQASPSACLLEKDIAEIETLLKKSVIAVTDTKDPVELTKTSVQKDADLAPEMKDETASNFKLTSILVKAKSEGFDPLNCAFDLEFTNTFSQKSFLITLYFSNKNKFYSVPNSEIVRALSQNGFSDDDNNWRMMSVTAAMHGNPQVSCKPFKPETYFLKNGSNQPNMSIDRDGNLEITGLSLVHIDTSIDQNSIEVSEADKTESQENGERKLEPIDAAERDLSALPECRILGAKTNCFGAYTFPSGDQYVGEWLDGRPHGQGTYTFLGGAQYTGSHKTGLFDGFGTYIFDNGVKQEGEWVDGVSLATLNSPLDPVWKMRAQIMQQEDEIAAQTEQAALAERQRELMDEMLADLRRDAQDTNINLANTLALLATQQERASQLEQDNQELSRRAEELTSALNDEELNRVSAAFLRERLEAAEAALSQKELEQLSMAAAAEKLRADLEQSEAAISSVALELNDQRKKAEETLALLAAAQSVEKTLGEKLATALVALEAEAQNADTDDLRSALSKAIAARQTAEQQLTSAEQKAALLATAQAELQEAKAISTEAQRKMALLSQEVRELRAQIGGLQATLDDYKRRDADNNVKITNLGSELNVALAQVAAESKRNLALEVAEKQRLEEEKARLEAEAKTLELYKSDF
ncbi:hypothetical protein N9I60_02230, partial [Planktomarina temperata]|nr:hypothetical protein [Planktomarina temperata]